ncbi:hypothetical protein SODALDRAFT_183529 [Sodiomyces alkalinus F11]|uniref:Secreted protein n=1 Tax=Sodiomyces alkalinus (strain CBS 110278 / VKM F-3762 / F11) TaxID=1314773 RepID=A0A3N2PUQ6_SODAK|nr:hypothetical protein SODALDRAFT_183529 [Sodiomyces alkalinus F11]ROT38194.1 hypothetical protein SODALDRAFT_183529 [Sodiomyces alkalinus F11]
MVVPFPPLILFSLSPLLAAICLLITPARRGIHSHLECKFPNSSGISMSNKVGLLHTIRELCRFPFRFLPAMQRLVESFLSGIGIVPPIANRLFRSELKLDHYIGRQNSP